MEQIHHKKKDLKWLQIHSSLWLVISQEDLKQTLSQLKPKRTFWQLKMLNKIILQEQEGRQLFSITLNRLLKFHQVSSTTVF
jgi:hypothetical protein